MNLHRFLQIKLITQGNLCKENCSHARKKKKRKKNLKEKTKKKKRKPTNEQTKKQNSRFKAQVVNSKYSRGIQYSISHV